ncbi:MAG: glycoside hydrolase family 3 N-terminal domain-containing protein [Marinifilaceae bacterium]
MRKTITYLFVLIFVWACNKNPEEEKYKNASLPVHVRVADLMGKMTLEEKIAQMRHIHAYSIVENGELNTEKLNDMLQGRSMGFIEAITVPGKTCLKLMNQLQDYMRTNTRLGIPIFTVTESLHGSVHDGSTIFPQAIALGSTFNTELAYAMTSATAKELAAQGIKQSLTPVLDVCRDLRWGRVEECFGEDAFLNAHMGIAQVRGYLDNGISPMIKHFGAHGQPQGGLNLASVSCGQRELLSVHLKPFEMVIKETAPWAVMSSYNSWNNEPNSSSAYLMTQLLRDEWGFQGYVYSDWGAIGMLNYFHRTALNNADAAIQALTAGLDAEASDNSYMELQQLVENGDLEMKYIDKAVERILTAKFEMGLFEYELPVADDYDNVVHSAKHISLSRSIAEESVILLRNENNILPLQVENIRSIALIGPNANQVQFGDYTWSRDNKDGVTLLQSIREQYGDKIEINYAQGCDLVSDNKAGFNEAVKIAKKSDVSIVVVGSASASLARDYSNATCGEGFDLNDLTLTGVQEKLIQAVYETGKPVIVVLLAGKPFAMPWVKEHIEGILVQWYPGEQGGNALADVLFGRINPSGKLNYSFPKSVGHLPCYYNYLPTDKGFYRQPGNEQKPGKDYVFSSPGALWAFGHGLSYTQFDYLDATLNKEDYTLTDTIQVDVKILNSGKRCGKEVVQIYVRDIVSSVATPIHNLKAFRKVAIDSGKEEIVTLSIPVQELAIYDKEMKKVVEPGAFELQIGSASDDIRIKKVITVDAAKEKKIVTLKDRSRKQMEDKSIASKTITIKGTIRDVQANLLKRIKVKVGNSHVYTDDNGTYAIKALSTDTIYVDEKQYKQEIIPIKGKEQINIRLLSK